MKSSLLCALTCILLLVPMSTRAAKSIYIPSGWSYDSSTGEYTQDGYSYSMSRKRESDNFVVFWSSEYGTTAPDALSASDFYYVDVDNLLEKAEEYYALYATTMGFVNPTTSTTMSRYKCMIMLMHSDVWAAYGGGFDYVVPALWINPATCKPVGHTIAHEIGHSFHYMAFAESNNHQDSSTDNTGFHLPCGNGQAIWEQTAQYQAASAEPTEMFNESFPLFGNCANYAFSHEWMRYQSYWFHFYLNQYYNDPAMVGKVWNQPMKNQSNDGSATDFCQAYIALKGLTAAQFYERYFDYALHCATFDFDIAATHADRDTYIGKFDYHAVQLGEKKYQVAYHSAPQSTGFNVIELSVPSSGTTITTKFTALQHGCALHEDDPATYNDGNANANVKANVSNYNSDGTASYRGFRVGYVFLKSDGTRVYYNDNTVHCTGTAEVTENISTTVPANTSRMFLVVAPALTTYVRHPWDEDITNDDQWPYSFELVGTDATSATIVEKIPDEPTFTKAIDGRNIADVTLTYKVTLPVDASGYTGASITFSGNALNALCTAFQMEGDSIFNNIITYTANQSNSTVMSDAANADGTLQSAAKTSGGDFGHWFNASGTSTSWGNSSYTFAEFTKSTKSATIGQFPGANSAGDTRTIREALRYKDSSGNTATAYLVFNISFKTNAAATAYLTDIDYTEPPVSSTTVTAYRGYSVQSISLSMEQGASDSYVLTDTNKSDLIYDLGYASTVTYSTFSGYFQGYNASLASASSSTNVYYYTLPSAPAATSSKEGNFVFYKAAASTTDSEYNGQYVNYFDGTGACITMADNAKLKVVFDKSSGQFSVKAADDCPTGNYTLYIGMARRYKSGKNTRIYVAYFPISVTVTETVVTDMEETLNVERYTGMGYDVTSTTVDFTAAKTFLGVSEVTTDMLRIVNPNGDLVSDYATYDGWFTADGTAATWGNSTKINVKFYQAIPDGTYTICDMDGADVVGTTYTVKWALVANDKTYTYNINVTFVERPAAEIDFDDLTQIGSNVTVDITSTVGSSYEGLTSDVDVAGILSTLGVNTLDDVTIYAVQSDGTLDDNYKVGTTDGWRNADGDWQTWGENAYFYVKADFTIGSAQLYDVGGYPGKTDSPVTYTAAYAFVKNGSATNDAVILKVNLIYPYVPSVITYTKTIYVQSRETESLRIPLTDSDVTGFGLTWDQVRTKLTATHTANSNSIGVANHTLATDEIMLYPADYSTGNIDQTQGVSYADNGHRYGSNNELAIALDWIGSSWVIYQTPGTLTAGSTYSVSNALLYNDGSSTKTIIFKYDITVAAMPDIVLADTETSYEQQSGNYNVTLQRSLPAGKWLSFCAPFNIASGEWADMGISAVRRLGSVVKNGDDITLNFTEVTDGIWVGIPYLIQMSETKTGITKTETGYGAYDGRPTTTVESTDGSVTAQMIGTYVKIDLDDDVYYLESNKFRHTTYTSDKKTAMKGWRAYFTVTDNSASGVKSLLCTFDDETVVPTSIVDLDIRLNDRVDVFTLTGKKVRGGVQRLQATDGLPAGIYIVGGRKEIVR